MKKLITLFIAVVLTSSAFAQVGETVTVGDRVYETKRFRFGAYVSPNIAWMKPTTTSSGNGNFTSKNNGTSIGFTYGLMGEYWFAENYALVSGLQVTNAKGSITTTRTGGSVNNEISQADMKYKLNYLEIPVALKMKTDPVENFTFFGQAGLTPGFNIAKKTDYTIKYTDGAGTPQTASGTNEKLSGTLAVTPLQLSMSLGVGAEYPISNKLAGYLGIFFNNGFLDATNPTQYKLKNAGADVPGFSDGNTRVNNFQIRLGLFF